MAHASDVEAGLIAGFSHALPWSSSSLQVCKELPVRPRYAMSPACPAWGGPVPM